MMEIYGTLFFTSFVSDKRMPGASNESMCAMLPIANGFLVLQSLQAISLSFRRQDLILFGKRTPSYVTFHTQFSSLTQGHTSPSMATTSIIQFGNIIVRSNSHSHFVDSKRRKKRSFFFLFSITGSE